jgi:hypothetical protein
MDGHPFGRMAPKGHPLTVFGSCFSKAHDISLINLIAQALDIGG